MGKKSIGVVAAMPDEIRPLLRRVGKYRKGEIAGYRSFHFSIGGNSVTLVQSGMGPRRAKEATEALIRQKAPALIVNFGFGGAVRGETKVGDLVRAREVLLLAGEKWTRQPLPEKPGHAVPTLCDISEGVFITSAVIEDKRRVAALLPAQLKHPVLEMETAAVVAAAHDSGIPVLAIRAISDGADEDLGFSLEEFCDADLNIQPGKVMSTVARKPWIIPQLIRLAGNSRKAAERLADCLEILLKEG
ncbi:nucleoside phosphorylase [Geomonas sp. RF6]|uniref:phosphorylase family protein n=1 Tax=Geomonas sp. RF6 TaxID=2897342 RepID=UPI001E5CB87C|nr:nucleoside phosphorylase [Geomonas sp. RF6]UFS68663.1 nucleoside phosphorylase [Geomonas sp. RF6]